MFYVIINKNEERHIPVALIQDILLMNDAESGRNRNALYQTVRMNIDPTFYDELKDI